MVWGDGKYKEPPALQLAALFLHGTVEPVGNSDRFDENEILRPQKFIMTVSQPRPCHLERGCMSLEITEWRLIMWFSDRGSVVFSNVTNPLMVSRKCP